MRIYAHDDCNQHLTPAGHPECPERMAAVRAGLRGLAVEWHQAPLGTEVDILRAHDAAHVARIMASAPTAGWVALDGDTFLSPGSVAAALRAVGGMTAAVDDVLAGRCRRAFVATRPPGHHAERDRAMGFCLFNTVAIGALRALDHHGLRRVAIVDFDVHHGNGTQDILWSDPRCLFASSHQMPLYPGSGAANERGAQGQIVNLPLRAGGGGAALRAGYRDVILPRLVEFAPQLILVSAGFDAHEDDPLGGLGWRDEDYTWLTQALCDVADAACGGRIVSTLEGGYDLAALGRAAAAHVAVMMKGAPDGR